MTMTSITGPSIVVGGYHHLQHPSSHDDDQPTLSLSVDDDNEPPVALAIQSPSVDDDGTHTQPSYGWRRWSSSAPAFPDDHDIQLHRIDASAPALASAPFLKKNLLLLFSIPALPNEPQEPCR